MKNYVSYLGYDFDCFVSCERAGSADDGKYHKMSGDLMPTASIDRVEDIWYRALDLGIPTIAIGDGGNEMGMGLVHEEVLTSITNGDQIAAAAPTMWLLSCGVSNWGCRGLQHGLALLEKDKIHKRYKAKVRSLLSILGYASFIHFFMIL